MHRMYILSLINFDNCTCVCKYHPEHLEHFSNHRGFYHLYSLCSLSASSIFQLLLVQIMYEYLYNI